MVRKILGLGLASLSLVAFSSAQSKQGTPAVYMNTNGTINPSQVWVDASQFPTADMCQSIQAAIASVVTASGSSPAGLVIDARNFPLPTSGTQVLACSVNPFATQPNPLVLVTGGATSTSPGSAGGVLLLPGATMPFPCRGSFRRVGRFLARAPWQRFLLPGAGFTVPPGGGTVQVSGTSVTSSISWVSSTNVVGGVLFACPSAKCSSATFENAATVGILTDFKTTTTFNLGTNAQTTIPSGGFYMIMEPLMAWATTKPSTATGQLVNTTGSVIQDVGLDCSLNAGSTTYPAGCLPFYDQYGQERSQLKRIRITNFGSSTGGPNPLGIGIYSSTAQNGGPFDDIQMATASTSSSNVCVEVGGIVGGNPPTMRGIRGLTCTGPTGSSSALGVGVDINTQNFSLADAHFEDFAYGVEIGDLTSSQGISVSDISGGGSAATGTIVYVSGYCATPTSGANCASYATSDVKASNIFQPTTTAGPALNDAISGAGHTTTEATLGFYSLGDGSGPGAASTRPVLTTSSSIASTPYLPGTLPTGTPITAVQGTTGTLVQMSTGPAPSGDLIKYDGNGNAVDSALPVVNIAGTVPFFTSTSVAGSTTAALANTTIKLWGFSLPNAVATTAVTFFVSATDGTNSYSFGVYNASGMLLLNVGPSTSLVNAAGSKTASWASGTTLTPGKYYFATATNCASGCATLSGSLTGSFAVSAGAGAATGGNLTNPNLSFPITNAYAVGAVPTFTIH